ncbi:MAG: hypothetical protein EA405_05475 [Rhodospirillales bacterium]|nr:MAG: hypothetical protein EA405_05475 [Rhodospirillales bacterium]
MTALDVLGDHDAHLSDQVRNLVPDQIPELAPAPPIVPRRTWVLIFTDLTALLLAFFVLVFAMSGVDPPRWQATAQSLSRTLNPGWEPAPPPVAAFNTDRAGASMGVDLDYLSAVLADMIEDMPHLGDMTMRREYRALVLSVPTDAVFADDGMTLTGPGGRRLAAVGGLIRNIGNPVRVRAVVPQPADGPGPDSAAWGDAVMQAARVGGLLQAAGYRRTVDVHGGRAAAGAAGTIEFWLLGEDLP